MSRSGTEARGPVDEVDTGSFEHYEDAPLYDYEYRRRRADVSFYKDLVEELLGGSGRVLELACGSGRVTVPLARAGYQVLGIDLSGPMLARCDERLRRAGKSTRARVSLVRADMRRFALAERFPLVIMAFNSFEHLYTRVDVAACLACVRDHLAPGGYLLFDVQNPNLRWLMRDPGKRWARTRFTHPVTGRRFMYSTNHEYEPISQIALIRLYYQSLDTDEPERVVTVSQRKFFPAELEALLYHNGFVVRRRYGDFAGGILHGDCESQVVLCQVDRRRVPSR